MVAGVADGLVDQSPSDLGKAPADPEAAGQRQSTARPPRQASRLWNWFLIGFVIFWLIVTSGAIFPLLFLGGQEDLSAADRAQLRLLLLPCMAMAPLLLALRFRGMASLLLRNPILIMLMLWIMLSIFWSVDTELTSRRVLAFVANTLIACYLVLSRDLDWILKVLSWCMLMLLLASLVFILLFPSLGILPNDRGVIRGLNGVFLHKNSMGELAVFSLIVFFAAFRSQAVPSTISLGGLALALLLLAPTGAATSIVVALFVLIIQAWFLIGRLPARQRLILLAFATSAAFFVVGAIVLNLEAAFGALGRDTTLTGRTDIWPYVLHMSAERPILGYGYAAFWEMEAIARYVMDRFQWSIPTAHNGYLDILLGLGWVGLGLTLAFIVSMAFKLIARQRQIEPGVAVFALPILVYYLVFNLVESAMFSSSGLSWIIMVIAFLLLTPGLAAIRATGR